MAGGCWANTKKDVSTLGLAKEYVDEHGDMSTVVVGQKYDPPTTTSPSVKIENGCAVRTNQLMNQLMGSTGDDEGDGDCDVNGDGTTEERWDPGEICQHLQAS